MSMRGIREDPPRCRVMRWDWINPPVILLFNYYMIHDVRIIPVWLGSRSVWFLRFICQRDWSIWQYFGQSPALHTVCELLLVDGFGRQSNSYRWFFSFQEQQNPQGRKVPQRADQERRRTEMGTPIEQKDPLWILGSLLLLCTCSHWHDDDVDRWNVPVGERERQRAWKGVYSMARDR